MSKLAQVRTLSEMVEYFDSNIPKDKMSSDMTTEANVLWFVACCEARMVQDAYSTKDLALMLLDNVGETKPNPTPSEYVEHFLETMFEDVDYARKNGDDESADDMESDIVDIFHELIESHFGL